MFNSFIDLNKYFADAPVWIEDSSGQKHIVEDARLLLNINFTWSFGHLSDMESALQLIDAQSKMTHIVFSLSEINKLPDILVNIRSPDEAPPYARDYGLRIFLVDISKSLDDVGVEVYRFS